MNLDDLKKIHNEVAKTATSLGNALRTVVANGKVTFLSEDKVLERLETCHKCSYYDNGRCGLCNCICSVKAKVDEFECPLGKWNFERISNNWTFDESALSIIPMAFHKDETYIYSYVKGVDGITRFRTDLKTLKTIEDKV